MRVEGYAGYLERVILGERDEAMQDFGYGLPRINLLRGSMHKPKTTLLDYPQMAEQIC